MPLPTNIRRKVNAESVCLCEDLLENPIPFLADAPNLPVRLELHNPEDNVSAGTTMTEGSAAATEACWALHHIDILVLAVLDDVAWLEDAEGLLHLASRLSWGTLYGHGLGQTWTAETIVTSQRSVNHNSSFALQFFLPI